MNKKFLQFISINILVLMLIFIFNLFNVRICIFYHIFSIPCPGCGLTRSVLSLLKGDIILSLKYNILTIPLIISYIVYILLKTKDIIKKENKLGVIFSKYGVYIFIISFILVVVSEIKNILNPLLY